MTDIKADLVMWTYNGAATLDPVLAQINRVVPAENVGQKIVVDDGSTDDTVSIAESRGWRVIRNEGKGISDGANTALKHVETAYFCSFEQDLFLSPKWWSVASKRILNKKVAVFSGVRHHYPSKSMQLLHDYEAQRYVSMKGNSRPLALNARLRLEMGWGRTLDNSIYKTKVLMEIGGFPVLPVNGGVDTVLTWRIINAGYLWDVDFGLVSLHLNKTFLNELRCQFFYGSCYDAIASEVPSLPAELFGVIVRFLLSPVNSLHPAFSKHYPPILLAYPLCKLQALRGFVQSRRQQQ